MKRVITGAILLLALALAFTACGGGGGVKPAAEVGELQIFDPFARASLEEGAVYFAVRNAGPDDDAIIGADSPVAQSVHIHNTVMQDGTMRMVPVERIPLPAGAWVALSPGGYHIMLVDLKQELGPGDEVRLELRFEKAGTVTITVPVRSFSAEGGH